MDPLGKPPPGGASQAEFTILLGIATVSGIGSFPHLAGISLLVLPVDAQEAPSLSVSLSSLFFALTGSQASEPLPDPLVWVGALLPPRSHFDSLHRFLSVPPKSVFSFQQITPGSLETGLFLPPPHPPTHT